jgi:uncharacterized protein (DUF885 family)
MQADPLLATYSGDHRYNDQLPKVNAKAVAGRKNNLESLEQQLQQIEFQSLPESDQLNYLMFKRMLQNEINEIEFKAHTMPISKSFGFHLSFPELYQIVPLKDVTDYENYVKRLEAFPNYMADQIEQMRTGLSEGYLPAFAALVGIEDAVRSQIVDDAKKSPLYEPFRKYPANIGSIDQERLTARGSKAIINAISPAYQSLQDFLVDEYIVNARKEVGASTLPNGQKFYDHRIRLFTSSELSAEAIHKTGKDEVGRIRDEMDQTIGRTGFQGTFQEFIRYLRTNPQFYAETADQLLKEVSFVLKRMDGELPGLFGNLPRMPYGIRPIPDFSAPGNTTAYYFPPSGDGTKAGVYYVNTYDLASRPFYEIEALSLHEAVPGHHLQIALQQELEAIPNFRRFDYLTSTAFVEGWALYAERLGLEVGFYQDPFSDFGRLSYEMWRACRLVVDTGIHALGWSRQEAIEYMLRYTSLSELNIANEVDRYIAWPGQALAYKMGEIKIRELRERAVSELGKGFDLRSFHDVILERGAVPLDFLDDLVGKWISSQMNSQG